MAQEQSDASDSTVSSVIQGLIQPTIRFIIGLAGLFVLRLVLVQIPGADTAIPDLDLTVGLVIYGIITFLMFGVILKYASDVGGVLSREADGKTAFKRVSQLVGGLIVLFWAYGAFPWIPYFTTHPQQYDLLFLALGLFIGGWLAVLLYTNVDTMSELLADEVQAISVSSSQEDSSVETRRSSRDSGQRDQANQQEDD